MKIYSVSELNTEAREAMLLAFEYPITVKGEITDYRTSNGHQYFKLRDERGTYTVSCVLWKNSSRNINIANYLNMEVIVSAKVDFYAGFGQFQLNVTDLSEFGDGFLKKEIEKLKKKLTLEGMFDNKKNLPLFPKNIGILTARDSHALKDVCSKLNEKYPIANVFVYTSIVQGKSAPNSLITQLRKINQDNLVDLVLIVRGGGSLQDLMAFNDEGVVREISKLTIPTITGIGHKPDITLADYASDSAQETPTAAAVKSVPDINTLKQDLYHLEISLMKVTKNLIDSHDNTIKNAKLMININNPSKIIKGLKNSFNQNRSSLTKSINVIIKTKIINLNNQNVRKKQVLKLMKDRLCIFDKNNERNYKSFNKVIKFKITEYQNYIRLKLGQIKQLNPEEILKKGYAIVWDNNRKIIKNIKSIPDDAQLEIQMIDGNIKVARKSKKDLI
tara:strand:+ start:1284 stop:2621 length:1338 start_codon:yes stop_codon:yes gene_type:complete